MYETRERVDITYLPIPQYLPSIAHNQIEKPEKKERKERERKLLVAFQDGSRAQLPATEEERAIIGEERRGNEWIGDKIGG